MAKSKLKIDKKAMKYIYIIIALVVAYIIYMAVSSQSTIKKIKGYANNLNDKLNQLIAYTDITTGLDTTMSALKLKLLELPQSDTDAINADTNLKAIYLKILGSNDATRTLKSFVDGEINWLLQNGESTNWYIKLVS